nr:4124_t:CDS:2 [Entrophospora candida]
MSNIFKLADEFWRKTTRLYSGPLITSHLYLLIGCAGCIWLKGILTSGLGDSMASMIGRRYDCHKWPGTSKTVEGFVAFIFFQLSGVFVLSKFGMAVKE